VAEVRDVTDDEVVSEMASPDLVQTLQNAVDGIVSAEPQTCRSRNVGQVVAQKGPPGRGGDLGTPRHPPPNCGLADLDAELEQFPVDAGRSPQRVGFAHAADQITDFCADLGSSRTA
jgi:hypothetical protein